MMGQKGIAHEGLWEQLVGLDGFEAARRAKCQYLDEPGRYVITMLNSEYVVVVSQRRIFCERSDSEVAAGFLEQLCILAYLINAKDVGLAGKLVRAESLPGGQFFFRGVHNLPVEKLKGAFGEQPEGLPEVGERFGGKRCEFGDASVEVLVLPRVPMTFIIWRGDDEFEGRASILFDQTTGAHLPLDALLAAVNVAVNAMIKT